MVQRDLRPAALAVVRLILRACGWEPVYETTKDILTVANVIRGSHAPPPSKDLKRIVTWVQKSLSAILQVEYSNAPENDINAAAMAVTEVLSLPLRDELLLQAVTDSSALESQLLQNGGGRIRASLASEPATSIFDLLLRSACQHLAEVTLTAPEFGPLALRQLLRNQTQLNAISYQIARTLNALATSHGQDQDFGKYTARYLAKISEQLDFLDIPGIDLDRYRQRYNLSMAYIPMKTNQGQTQDFEINSVSSLTRVSNYLYVAGEPGSGKSTLLKWAAVQTARSNMRETSQRQTVPFLIKLRAIPDTLPDLDDFGAPMTHGLVIPKPAHWSGDLIASGRALLLFDGLDEVPERRRESVVKWIDQIYEDHSRRGTRIVVTTRVTAIGEARYRSKHASYSTLQPMPQGKIERFVYLWHRAVYASADAPVLSEWLATSEQLLARLENDPQLGRLASNPLLCAVICALYHARNQHLPSDRSELYEALLAMLLARRDAEREWIAAPLGLTDMQRLVRLLASHFLERERDELPESEVVEVIRQSLSTFRSHSIRDLRPKLILDHFVSRTGVLRQLPPENIVDFWHKSFQEFLAAQMLLAEGKDKFLADHAVHAQWREVIVWACSLMPIDRASDLVAGILRRADYASSDSERDYLTTIALSCAHFSVQLTEWTLTRINESAGKLIPPVTKAQRDAVVDLGAAAVPFLDDFLRAFESVESISQEQEEVLSSVISCLTRIGGEAANTTLSRMPDVIKGEFALQLAQGWSYVGSADYARRVLGMVPSPKATVQEGLPSEHLLGTIFAEAERGRRVTVEVASLRQLRSMAYLAPVYRPRIEVSLADLERDALGSGSSSVPSHRFLVSR